MFTSGCSWRPLPFLLPVERRARLERLKQAVHDALLVVRRVEIDERSFLRRPVLSLALLLVSRFPRPQLLFRGLPLLQDIVVRLLKRSGLELTLVSID